MRSFARPVRLITFAALMLGALAAPALLVAGCGAGDEGRVVKLAGATAKALEKDAAGTIAAVNAGKKPYSDVTHPDIYAFIDDMDMTVVAHKTAATRGTNLKGQPDVTGKLWRDQILENAAAGSSGWMDYVYKNSDGTGYVKKACYYEPVTGSDGVKYIACATHDVGPYQLPKLTAAQTEVKEFVDEALAYAQSHDKEAALQEFMDTTGRFYRNKGSLYIFAYSMKGDALCLPAQPEKVGENRWDLKDESGGYFVRAFVYVAQSTGSGWVCYRYPNPSHDMQVQDKTSYVAKVDDEWLLGAGTYAAGK
jgi:polar amino acid transport system substrate-binding protein